MTHKYLMTDQMSVWRQQMAAWRRRLARRVVAVTAAGVAAGLTFTPAVSMTFSAAALGSAPAAQMHKTTGEAQTVKVADEPDGSAVELDLDIYRPAGAGPFPAVVLAHGFGGSKRDLAGEAKQLADQGFLVAAYSARGFGKSGGKIHLNDPEFEVADARAVIDVLAKRDDVVKDSDADPRIGFMGSSYGGAVSLMAAGTDPRVDAVVASITWNNLATALFPNNTANDDATAPSPSQTNPDTSDAGPFKQRWVATLMSGTRFNTNQLAALLGLGDDTESDTSADKPDAVCARFDPDLCKAMVDASENARTGGKPSPQLLKTLATNSPQSTLGQIKAPTLLIQGMADTLFGIEHADRNAQGLAAAGTTHAVRWTDGGHDGTSSNAEADQAAATTWLAHFLKPATKPTDLPTEVPAFSYSLFARNQFRAAPIVSATSYPTADDTTWQELPFAEPDQQATIINPPGGELASTTTLPGLGSFLQNAPTYPLAALPGQSVAFALQPLKRKVQVLGAPRIKLTVKSDQPTANLFVTLWLRNGRSASQQRALVAPVKVSNATTKQTITVALPPAAYQFDEGSQWVVLVSTTDTGYANPVKTRTDTITLASAGLQVPVANADASVKQPFDRETAGVLWAIGAVGVGILAWVLWNIRRRRQLAVKPEYEDIPLVVENLVHTYSDGHRAVDDVSWRAERGQVVGLLGPNGAGKTTTMRMLLGLIKADSGSTYILGTPVTPSSPVLRNVGSLVEGPGFLPHLTGRQNLEAYWKATGRPTHEADFEEAFNVAALGGAIDRPARTYSQGMKMRLGIAQAMLGSPDVLMLDEPTNGLDPAQIAGLRQILQDYAATGRTVIVSSHLLAEVEMTCSHVVVMHAGRVLLEGAVADLVASDDTTLLDLAAECDLADASKVLAGVDGIDDVVVASADDGHRLVVTSTLPRGEVVAAAVAADLTVESVAGHKQLEEVFMNVILQAHEPDDGVDVADKNVSKVERLRQVRAR